MLKPTDNSNALAAFFARKAEIDTILARLRRTTETDGSVFSMTAVSPARVILTSSREACRGFLIRIAKGPSSY
jgi:hypothetical protein